MLTRDRDQGSLPGERTSGRRGLIWIAAVVTGVLALIGARFFASPEVATAAFGLDPARGADLARVVGLRDLWLGLLGVALAGGRQWAALTLWFGLGALVCLADAGLVAAARESDTALAFHIVAAFLFAGLGVACHREGHRAASRSP
jgi:hypothetical protein